MWARSRPRASAIGRCRDRHSSSGDQQFGAWYLTDAADVVLVEMADHRIGDVGGAVAEALEPGGEGLVLVDVEPGEAAIDHADTPSGKYDGSVTEARSCPVSNTTTPSACSMT